jgi:hypothetical protein
LDLGLFCPQNGIIGRIFKKPISITVSHYKVHDQGLYGNELLQIIYHCLAKLDIFEQEQKKYFGKKKIN